MKGSVLKQLVTRVNGLKKLAHKADFQNKPIDSKWDCNEQDELWLGHVGQLPGLPKKVPTGSAAESCPGCMWIYKFIMVHQEAVLHLWLAVGEPALLAAGDDDYS